MDGFHLMEWQITSEYLSYLNQTEAFSNNPNC